MTNQSHRTSALHRREFCSLNVTWAGGALIGMAAGMRVPHVHAANAIASPKTPSGVATGDVAANSCVVWSRADRPSRMWVDVSEQPEFPDAATVRVRGSEALSTGDFTSKLRLGGLRPSSQYHYRVLFQDLTDSRLWSEPELGSFRTPSLAKEAKEAKETGKVPSDRPISFVWSGDVGGQGYGIDEGRGGYRTYAAMLETAPDFFVHCGDHIYADNPFPARLEIGDGEFWNNVTLPETSKVAETLEEFHANYRYNLMDASVRRFHAKTPMYAQWDDHETTNNWYPTEVLADPRYQVQSAALLSARARRAFLDYMPMMPGGPARDRIYRRMPHGPLELFLLDMRSYRGANNANDQPGGAPLLGRRQLAWLKRSLQQTKATWKVICSDMPLGLVVRDGKAFENAANGQGGMPLGREREIAELLQWMKQQGIRNVIWITADVHYAASHYYNPKSAGFTDFDGFWEFVSGPLHAGTFGPGQMDPTFGPEVRFHSLPKGMKPNRPPSEGLQFFGHVQYDPQSASLTITHKNAAGDQLWSMELPKHAS